MTELPTGPMTELEAINLMLTAFGEANVSSLSDDTQMNQDVAKALTILGWTNREVQSEGWNFNRLRNYRLYRNDAGEIELPSGTLKVDTTACQRFSVNAVHRGNRLYDGINFSFDWIDNSYADGGLPCDFVIQLPFEDLPASARHYIALKAARRMVGNTERETPFKFTQLDENEAKVRAMEDDAVSDDRNLLTHNPHFQRFRRR